MFRETTAQLAHASTPKSERLAKLRNAISQKIIDQLDPNFGELALEMPETRRNIELANDVRMEAQTHFKMSDEEASTFKLIVHILATELKIAPQTINEIQKLYDHVTSELKQNDFLPQGVTIHQGHEYAALQKYNFVVGITNMHKDSLDRSTLLSSFLGLAIVNDEFRDILSRMELPKKIKGNFKSTDGIINSLGNMLMDNLSKRFSGKKQASNVRESLDHLTDALYRTLAEEQSNLMRKLGSPLESLNTRLVAGLERLSDWSERKARENGIKSKPVKAAANTILRSMSFIASETNGKIVAQELLAKLNKMNVWQPLHDLVTDMIGRTELNKNVYDMAKQVRALVAQNRQQYREEVPRIIKQKFSRELSDSEWNTLYTGMGRTDLASLASTLGLDRILELITDEKELRKQIKSLQDEIINEDPDNWDLLDKKMRQYAKFALTGEYGTNLLRNAEAIANLYQERATKDRSVTKELVRNIDQLTTLYTLELLSKNDKSTLSSLVQNEREGIEFVLNYLIGQRKTEQAKLTTTTSKINHYKGYIPREVEDGSLIIAPAAKAAELKLRGYVEVGKYEGTNVNRNSDDLRYYYSKVPQQPPFSQGIIQNIAQTASGVHLEFGRTLGTNAGLIVEKSEVRRLTSLMHREKGEVESLSPIYNELGMVVAFERTIDPKYLSLVQKDQQNLADVLGMWRGRQIEEEAAVQINKAIIRNLKEMRERDIKDNPENAQDYINVLDENIDDPIIKDAVSLFSESFRREIQGSLFVNKAMLKDVIGYREASVADFWTGNSRISPENQEKIRKALMGIFGKDTFKILTTAERNIQGIVSAARTSIVIKSVIVPVANMISNTYQLMMRGVPLTEIIKGYARFTNEIENFARNRLEEIRLEAELNAVGTDHFKAHQLRAKLKSIRDNYTRMTIYPLIEAGELSTIADVGMTAEDLNLTSGDLVGYLRQKIDLLPPGAKTLARYGFVTRDTALFQGLQKATQYGDFIAKAVLHEHYTKRKGMSQEEALGRITEEFVNYDILPGRARSYLENMGLLWFFNYKLRISKVAINMIQTRPLYVLLSMFFPKMSGVGTVIEDNLFGKIIAGTLPYSIGPRMITQGYHLLPVVQATA